MYGYDERVIVVYMKNNNLIFSTYWLHTMKGRVEEMAIFIMKRK